MNLKQSHLYLFIYTASFLICSVAWWYQDDFGVSLTNWNPFPQYPNSGKLLYFGHTLPYTRTHIHIHTHQFDFKSAITVAFSGCMDYERFIKKKHDIRINRLTFSEYTCLPNRILFIVTVYCLSPSQYYNYCKSRC